MKTEDVKKIYNSAVKEKFKSDYEYNRWFKNEILKAGYEMEKKFLEYHLPNGDSLRECLELGPGPGTWTKILADKYSGAHIDLVDISEEMLKLAKKSLAEFKEVGFFESDFLRFSADKKYDFFFSSRAIEYFPDKAELARKIAGILKSGGEGFIITKTAKYFINKILRRKISNLHKGQISPKYLKRLLLQNGFKDIRLYPAGMSFPFIKSPKINKLLFRIFHKQRLNFVSKFFSESYCAKFIKV